VSGGIAPPFLTSVLDGGEWLALPPGKNPSVSIVWAARWAQESVWTLGRKEKLLSLPTIKHRFVGRPARSLVAIPTELSELVD
jgi:hypothetical protein